MRKRKPFLYIIVRDFISLFFPDYCAGCFNSLVKGESLICTRCMLEMPQTHYHLQRENQLKLRLEGRVPLIHALGFYRFSKRGRIQHILHALKYKNQPELAVVLGRVYGQKLKEAEFTFDLIIPVPLHATRLRKRGYNQSSKFAEGLSEILEIPFSEKVLVRSVKTDTQTRKTRLRRWENVSEVFVLTEPSPIRGKHVLLVDDVVTTGATIEACAAVLHNSGCRGVSIACIAVA
jgi:ComF family protein